MEADKGMLNEDCIKCFPKALPIELKLHHIPGQIHKERGYPATKPVKTLTAFSSCQPFKGFTGCVTG